MCRTLPRIFFLDFNSLAKIDFLRIIINHTQKCILISRHRGGIVNVVLGIFCRVEEAPSFERHHSRISVNCKKYRMLHVIDMKRYITIFLGINEQARKYDIGCSEMKLYHLTKSTSGKTENFALIVTQSQWEMELPSRLIPSKGCSEAKWFAFCLCDSFHAV